MDRRIIGAAAFLVLLSFYITVLVAMIPVIPLLSLVAIALWTVIRGPFKYPERLAEDLRRFSRTLAEWAERLLRPLVQPFRGDSSTSSRRQNNGLRND